MKIYVLLFSCVSLHSLDFFRFVLPHIFFYFSSRKHLPTVFCGQHMHPPSLIYSDFCLICCLDVVFSRLVEVAVQAAEWGLGGVKSGVGRVGFLAEP